MIIKPKAQEIERRTASDEECLSLGGTPPVEVTCVTRVMMAKSHPVAYLVDVLPLEILRPEELRYGFTGSVLDFLTQRGEPALLASRAEIQAVTATTPVARALGIQRGEVLLSFISQLYSKDNKVIDLSNSYFLPGYFRFHVVRKLE
jgi:GntR family transcriptional regulator